MRQRPRTAFLVTLLVWAMVAGTVFYPAFAVLASSVMGDLGLTPTTYGIFLFVFSATAAGLSPRGGRLADRLGGRSSLALTLGLASVGFLAIASSRSLWTLSASAVVLAVGQATMNPATNKLIANFTEPGTRGLITGVKQSGVYVGYVLSGLLAPPMEERWGWSSFFVVLTALMAFGAVVALWGLPKDAPDASEHAQPHPPIDPWVNALAVYAFAMGLGSSSASFLPLFAETELGFTTAGAGALTFVLGLLAIGTRIAGARVTEKTHRYRAALTIAAFAGVAFGATAIWSISLPPVVWLAVVAFALGFSAWNAIGMLAVIDLADAGRAGAATGRVLLGFLAGVALGPVAFGVLVDTVGYRSVWVATGVFAVMAAFSMGRWHPPKRA